MLKYDGCDIYTQEVLMLISGCGSYKSKSKQAMFGRQAETYSGVSANTADDDVLIMRSIREITSRGNNAEVKRRSDGRLAV